MCGPACPCARVTVRDGDRVPNSLSPHAVRGSRPGKNVQLTEGEIRGLCLKSREIFLSQPILLELEAPLKICGELEGHVEREGTRHPLLTPPR